MMATTVRLCIITAVLSFICFRVTIVSSFLLQTSQSTFKILPQPKLLFLMNAEGKVNIQENLAMNGDVFVTLSRASNQRREILQSEWEILLKNDEELSSFLEEGFESKLAAKIGEDIIMTEYSKDIFENLLRSDKKGREAVGAAMKQHQRLVMQLDRSDGRSDLSAESIAEKYCQMFGVCFRTGGAAWTAAFNGLQFSGLVMPSYIESTENRNILFLDKMMLDAATRLIEYPVGDDSSVPIQGKKVTQDMMLGLARIAIRFLFLREQMIPNVGKIKDAEYIVKLGTLSSSFVPDLESFLTMWCFDFKPSLEVNYEEDEEMGAIFKISNESASEWIKENALEKE